MADKHLTRTERVTIDALGGCRNCPAGARLDEFPDNRSTVVLGAVSVPSDTSDGSNRALHSYGPETAFSRSRSAPATPPGIVARNLNPDLGTRVEKSASLVSVFASNISTNCSDARRRRSSRSLRSSSSQVIRGFALCLLG